MATVPINDSLATYGISLTPDRSVSEALNILLLANGGQDGIANNGAGGFNRELQILAGG